MSIHILFLALWGGASQTLVLDTSRVSLPAWSGALARLAESLLTIGALIGIPTVLGAVGLLKLAPLVVACVACGLIAGLLARRDARAASTDAASPAQAPDRFTLACAGAVVLVLAAQWTRVIVSVLHGRMHYFDLIFWRQLDRFQALYPALRLHGRRLALLAYPLLGGFTRPALLPSSLERSVTWLEPLPRIRGATDGVSVPGVSLEHR